jgi:hypothetical protein
LEFASKKIPQTDLQQHLPIFSMFPEAPIILISEQTSQGQPPQEMEVTAKMII